MIFLLSLSIYLLYFKNLDLPISYIKKSVKTSQRSLLYNSVNELNAERNEIRKCLIVAALITLFIDVLILSKAFSLLFMSLNLLITPFTLLSIYRLEVKSKYEKSYKDIHMELPLSLQQIYCLLSINYSIEDALFESISEISNQTLKDELSALYIKLSGGYDLSRSLEEFFYGIDSQYILRFRSVLISHYYYGSSSSKENFISLIYDLLTYRVLLLKEEGEKIKVKLIIPIIIIFVSTLISLALPIIINLNS